MEDKSKGAWIVHHSRKLQGKLAGEFKAIKFAGKAGLLLSRMSGDEEMTVAREKVDAFAAMLGLEPETEVPPLLAALQEQKLIDVATTSGDVVVLGVTPSSTLAHTSKLFEARSPEPSEWASIWLAELGSDAPIDRSVAEKNISDQYKLSKTQTRTLVDRAISVGITDHEKVDKTTQLLFNGNLFRRRDDVSLNKVQGVLSSFTPNERACVATLDHKLAVDGCVSHEKALAILGPALFNKVQSIGLYDVSLVANEKEQRRYVTKPAAFNKYAHDPTSDAFDDAKALVASLSYGMERRNASEGQIQRLGALLSKLIAGQWIGPATAIGQDYQILEHRGVVATKRVTGDRFSLKLLKREIGELARQVLTEGDAASSASTLAGSTVTNFHGPERQREEARQDAAADRDSVAKALAAIRKNQ